MDLIESEQGAVRHPWETTRYGFFRDLLTSARTVEGARVLDVGSGDAWFASKLGRDTNPRELVCVDANYRPEDLRRLSALHPHVRFSAEPVEGRFDVIVLLDVAEHVEDDIGFLQAIVEHSLADDGLVMFSVPAGPELWTSHDVALFHHRRYTAQQARTVLESAGLRVLREGSAYASLRLPRALSALRERVSPPQGPAKATGEWRAPGLVTKLVEKALEADLAVCRWASRNELPLRGLSTWALCEKAARGESRRAGSNESGHAP
jgi:SAM-dependent methyltransferase